MKEELAVWRLVRKERRRLDAELSPGGYNVGVNAGQTVEHAHVHPIPRYVGDVDDPSGGVRWLIRSRARYWSKGPEGPILTGQPRTEGRGGSGI